MSLKKYHVGGALPRLALRAVPLMMVCCMTLPAWCLTPLSPEQESQLSAGEVVLEGSLDHRRSGIVEGKILINSCPDRVWSIVVNPLEFANKIQKHLRQVRFIQQSLRSSVQECEIEVAAFFPRITYRVESEYDPVKRIDFRRVGGMIKNFHGYWLLEPRDNGRKTLVTYAMYIDPGFFVPQWIMRQGLRRELPQTLTGIRNRAHQLEAESTTALVPSRG